MPLHRYIFIIFLMFPVVGESVVFKCKRLNGTISYQEFPCSNIDEVQTTLHISSYNTNISNVINNKYLTMLEKENKRQARKVKKARKIGKTKRKKELMQKKRCNNAKLKIRDVQSKLRAGYTIKQGIKLNEQLARYYELEKKYCGLKCLEEH